MKVLGSQSACDCKLDLTNIMIYYWEMKKLNIHEAKAHFSEYLNEVEKGENIILCRRNLPIAEIRPISRKLSEKRPIGLAKGDFTVPASFFDELPEEVIASFSGESR